MVRDRGLRLIALLKLTHAALLLAAGLSALKLLDPDINGRVQQWTSSVATTSDRRLVQHFLAHVVGLSPGRLELLALGALLYAILFATEGVGLWLGRRWAEYLTVVATSSFLPVELFEVVQRLTPVRVGALALNIAVVGYLVYRIRRPQAHNCFPQMEAW